MKIGHKKEVTVTIELNDREAKIIACLIGALSPKEMEDAIKRGVNFDRWIGELEYREVINVTGILYDTLYDIF